MLRKSTTPISSTVLPRVTLEYRNKQLMGHVDAGDYADYSEPNAKKEPKQPRRRPPL